MSHQSKVEVFCRRCAQPFYLDRATYESAIELDVWDDEHPWCADCNRERIRERKEKEQS